MYIIIGIGMCGRSAVEPVVYKISIYILYWTMVCTLNMFCGEACFYMQLMYSALLNQNSLYVWIILCQYRSDRYATTGSRQFGPGHLGTTNLVLDNWVLGLSGFYLL